MQFEWLSTPSKLNRLSYLRDMAEERLPKRRLSNHVPKQQSLCAAVVDSVGKETGAETTPHAWNGSLAFRHSEFPMAIRLDAALQFVTATRLVRRSYSHKRHDSSVQCLSGKSTPVRCSRPLFCGSSPRCPVEKNIVTPFFMLQPHPQALGGLRQAGQQRSEDSREWRCF